MRRPALALLAPVLAALPACTDFATPAQLEHTTVLAVVADPPIVAPGATSELSIAVADHTGPVTPPTAWTLVDTTPGVAPLGTLVDHGDGTATYTAPDPVPPLPQGVLPVDSVQATVTPATDPAIVAVKAVGVAAVDAHNPTITDVTIDGTSVLGGGQLAAGQTAQLAVTTDPPAGDKTTYAWYATAGTIDHYQSSPTTIVAADQPGPSWLFVVVRDGTGGMAWRGLQVTVP